MKRRIFELFVPLSPCCKFLCTCFTVAWWWLRIKPKHVAKLLKPINLFCWQTLLLAFHSFAAVLQNQRVRHIQIAVILCHCEHCCYSDKTEQSTATVWRVSVIRGYDEFWHLLKDIRLIEVGADEFCSHFALWMATDCDRPTRFVDVTLGRRLVWILSVLLLLSIGSRWLMHQMYCSHIGLLYYP